MAPHRKTLAALATLCLSACGGQEPSVPAAPASAATAATAPAIPAAPTGQATFAGFGDMRFGMDEAAFRQAWGGELKTQPPAAGSTCAYFYPSWSKTPPELGFMFEDGKFVRYDVATAKETAPGGGKVGMDKGELARLYGDKGETFPDKYDPAASTFRVRGEGGAAAVFAIGADGKVSTWRVGMPPQVDYVEGCH
jgi:hypothetical protein